jgi:hypothetical protein
MLTMWRLQISYVELLYQSTCYGSIHLKGCPVLAAPKPWFQLPSTDTAALLNDDALSNHLSQLQSAGATQSAVYAP